MCVCVCVCVCVMPQDVITCACMKHVAHLKLVWLLFGSNSFHRGDRGPIEHAQPSKARVDGHGLHWGVRGRSAWVDMAMQDEKQRLNHMDGSDKVHVGIEHQLKDKALPASYQS